MHRYVSFEPGDGSPSFVCPKCNKPFTQLSPPYVVPAGHLECGACCNRTGVNQNSFSYRYSGPHQNSSLSALASTLRTLWQSVNKGLNICSQCDAPSEKLLMCNKCSKNSVCVGCLVRQHNGHGWGEGRMTSADIHLSYYNHFSKVDHDLFPDKRTLEVGARPYVVSASFLAMHSPYFHRLFYSTAEARGTEIFILDEDWTAFRDLLDMIYPWTRKEIQFYADPSKKMNTEWAASIHSTYGSKEECCDICSKQLRSRFALMIKYEFVHLIHRINRRYNMTRKLELYKSLNDGWKSFKKYVVPYFSDFNSFSSYYNRNPAASEVQHLFAVNHVYEPVLPVPLLRPNRDYPDTRVLIIEGLPVVVSASLLCIHAPLLTDFFYGEKNREKKIIDFDLCSMDILNRFISSIGEIGKVEKGDSFEFLRFCRSVKARFIVEDYLRQQDGRS